MKAKVKVSPGKKSGTKLAGGKMHIAKTEKAEGRPMYQTRAQLNVYLWDKNGKPRPKRKQD